MKKAILYLFLAGLLSAIIISWWFESSSYLGRDINSTLIGISRLIGLLAALLLPLQLILIGRVKWVESVFGLDKLSRIHRTNGLVILGLILAHPILMIWAYSGLGEVSLFSQTFSFLTGEYGDILQAAAGIAILVGTIVLSLTIVRRKLKYEWWYWVHLFNYIALVFIFSHVKEMVETSKYWQWPTLWIAIYVFTALNVIWFRFTKPVIKLWRHQFTVSKVVDLGPATSIYITGKDIKNFHINAGQFMIFRFLQPGFWTEAHPFSLSVGPNEKEIRLTAKKLGDFTSELPKIQVGTKVLIDGPHGIFTEKVASKDKLLFIAGGIGITPIRSILESLGNRFPDKTLLYSNKTPAENILGDEIEVLAKQNNFRLVNIYSNEQVLGAEYGMLNKEMIIKLVPDITDRDIFLCGPPPMMKAVRAAMIELGVPKSQIHFERFAL